MPKYFLKVSELIELSPTAKAVRVSLENKPFPFQPGQFVIMELDLEKTGKFKVNSGKSSVQKRPFSMSSSPLQKNYLEVTIKTTENAFVSDYLVNCLQKGEIISINGPFGKFYFDENNTKNNIILLGAGSGISPLMSIFRYIKEKNLKIKTHLIFSNKAQNEILWRKEIESLSKKNLSHDFTLTREKWFGIKGRINKEMIEKPNFNLKETDFYLCGPPDFVKTIEKILLEELNISQESIKKEIYN